MDNYLLLQKHSLLDFMFIYPFRASEVDIKKKANRKIISIPSRKKCRTQIQISTSLKIAYILPISMVRPISTAHHFKKKIKKNNNNNSKNVFSTQCSAFSVQLALHHLAVRRTVLFPCTQHTFRDILLKVPMCTPCNN